MPTVKKILHYQNNGITKTELVEVPQSWQDVAALGLNIYGIFWLANIIVFCFEFLKKNPIYRTTIIWPKENLKRLEEIQLPDTTLNFLTEWICAVRSRVAKLAPTRWRRSHNLVAGKTCTHLEGIDVNGHHARVLSVARALVVGRIGR